MMKVLKKKRMGGFTLIELIVVIAILGILAAIAIPRLGGFRTTAQKEADIASAQSIGQAAHLHLATLSDAAAKAIVGADLKAAILAANLVPAAPDFTIAKVAGTLEFTVTVGTSGAISFGN